jgi:hypothetical protein
VDDDLVDEMLEKHLRWLELRQHHWHHDWSVRIVIYQCWTWIQPRLAPAALLLVKVLAMTVLWLPLVWMKLQLQLGLSNDTLTLYWTTLTLVVSDSRLLAIGQITSCIWTTVSLLRWDQAKLVNDLTLLVLLSFSISLTMTIWMAACGAFLLARLPPFLVNSLQGCLYRGYKRLCRFVESKDASLSSLAMDLEQLLGQSKPIPWDWTSLITDPHYVYLDRPSELPLPLPLFGAMPICWRIRQHAFGWLGSIRAWFWGSLWCLVLSPRWLMIRSATHVAMITLIALTCLSTGTSSLDMAHLAPYLSARA